MSKKRVKLYLIVLILVIIILFSLSIVLAIIEPSEGVVISESGKKLFKINSEGNYEYLIGAIPKSGFIICSFYADKYSFEISDINCIETTQIKGKVPGSDPGRYVYGGINNGIYPTTEKLRNMLGWQLFDEFNPVLFVPENRELKTQISYDVKAVLFVPEEKELKTQILDDTKSVLFVPK